MGVVYKAKDTRLKRTVALKYVPSELTKDKASKMRFVQEAQAAAALSHPNITVIHEVDEAEGQTFIAMECIDGQSLKDKLKEGPHGREKRAMNEYKHLQSKKADICQSCDGRCDKACPFGVPIRGLLMLTHRNLSSV